MSLDKSTFFGAATLKRRELPLEALDGSIWIRELTAAEAAEFQTRSTLVVDVDTKKFKSAAALVDLSIYVVTCAAQTAEGQPLFDKGDAEDLRRLGSALLEKIADTILNFSGIRTRQKKESSTTPPADSGTD
ncbi:MAG: hypothetical protein R3A44_44425 [Caldilineaceae bacterium]